ncbi:hypothetical protein DL93DRAFT_2075580, partial [Clavulina sp. PMI_390]
VPHPIMEDYDSPEWEPPRSTVPFTSSPADISRQNTIPSSSSSESASVAPSSNASTRSSVASTVPGSPVSSAPDSTSDNMRRDTAVSLIELFGEVLDDQIPTAAIVIEEIASSGMNIDDASDGNETCWRNLKPGLQVKRIPSAQKRWLLHPKAVHAARNAYRQRFGHSESIARSGRAASLKNVRDAFRARTLCGEPTPCTFECSPSDDGQNHRAMVVLIPQSAIPGGGGLLPPAPITSNPSINHTSTTLTPVSYPVAVASRRWESTASGSKRSNKPHPTSTPQPFTFVPPTLTNPATLPAPPTYPKQQLPAFSVITAPQYALVPRTFTPSVPSIITPTGVRSGALNMNVVNGLEDIATQHSGA